MNSGRVYIPETFVTAGMYPLIGGIRADDEHWEGVHPINIHCEGYRPLDRGYRGTQ